MNLEKENKILDSNSQLKLQIAFDLAQKFSSYINKSAALEALEKNTGISKRQMLRYLKKESIPQFLNLRTIYSYLHNETNFEKLLTKIPLIIKKTLEDKNPTPLTVGICNNQDFSTQMVECPAFKTFYWKTADGGLLSKKFIIRLFGDYGLKILKQMIDNKIIKEIMQDVYTNGPCRSLAINMEAAKKVATDLISNYYKPEKSKEEGNNYLGLNVLKLDSDKLNLSLKKIQDLNYEIMELSKQSTGQLKSVFTVLCLDSMHHIKDEEIADEYTN